MGDSDAAKTIVSERKEEFQAGLANAVQSNEVARIIGLPAEEHPRIYSVLLEHFAELQNSDDAVLRVLLKTKRYNVVKDAQSILSVKRCRDGASAADEEPKAKVAKAQVRKVPVADVRDTVDRVVDRFSVVVAELCAEIRRLRNQLDKQSSSGGDVCSGDDCGADCDGDDETSETV